MQAKLVSCWSNVSESQGPLWLPNIFTSSLLKTFPCIHRYLFHTNVHVACIHNSWSLKFSGLLLSCDHVLSPQGCHTVDAYIVSLYGSYYLRANVIHFTDNYCWFTLVQVLAHVTPHAVYFIMLESHLLQHNHCNSPVVAKYTPINMLTCIASAISQR